MNSPKRLHPVAAILRFLRSLRELALPLVIFIFVGGGRERLFDTLYVVGIIVIVLGMLIFGILTWLRFTYRVEKDELRIESGVFVRKKRYIPIEKIQSIDVSSGVIQRMFGLVKVQVETAGGGDEAEAVLSAVTKVEAEELKVVLSKRTYTDEQDEKIEEIDEVVLSPKDILIMASTSGGVGVVLSALFAFLTQVDEFIPYDYVYGVARNVVGSSVVIIVVGVVFVTLLAWIVAIVSASVKFGNYKLVKRGENLYISRGLLEKREMTIPIKRIQAVRVQENIVRQLFGFASIYIEVAGGAIDKKEETSTFLLPIVSKKEVPKLLERFTPDFIVDSEVNSLPKRAQKRYIFRTIIPSIVVILIISLLLNPWGYISVILLPIAYLVGVSMYREAGWVVKENRLLLRYRFLNRHTVFARRNRIQAFHFIHSFFQRKSLLASIVVSTQSKLTGKHFKVMDVDEVDAIELYHWYSYEKKQPS
ncbi:putative membrane protein [Bacillus mesophilus]|uniref:PH domain-containing protein n=1 Tax=Bacillus mesophilus TaxID=1808955 RepID=A0A6M0QBY6_9BACI|nr:PH domain-containing protein [Bacillus mesophilus]MBM7663140.1 putative membrane protein [Bacillus mesophilus]NEY73884.1 PH domain-containing protein [Bacillus mesophilus]